MEINISTKDLHMGHFYSQVTKIINFIIQTKVTYSINLLTFKKNLIILRSKNSNFQKTELLTSRVKM